MVLPHYAYPLPSPTQSFVPIYKSMFEIDFDDEIINGAAVTHGGSRRGAQ